MPTSKIYNRKFKLFSCEVRCKNWPLHMTNDVINFSTASPTHARAPTHVIGECYNDAHFRCENGATEELGYSCLRL